MPEMKDSGSGTVTHDNVCPRCGRSGGVQFFKQEGFQEDLAGRKSRHFVKLARPWCSMCKKSFDRDELQEEVTGRFY